VQPLQLIVPPQPSDAVPHAPAGQVVAAVHPHWFALLGVPPPHVCGEVHVPQLTVPPHPFGAVPQLSAAGHVVAATELTTMPA
jgi:hypothetical protein